MLNNQTPSLSLSENLLRLERALESKSNPQVLTRNPITLSYFDIQRLIHLQKQSTATKIRVQLPLRSDPEIQSLQQRIETAVDSGATVSSLSIHTSLPHSSDIDSTTGHLLDLLDLILHLSSDNVSTIQAFNAQYTHNTSTPRFTLIAGTLVSEGSFSIHLGKSTATVIQVILSTGELLSASATSQSTTDNQASHGTLIDAAKALRLYSCAVFSLQTRKSVTVKHISDKVVPVRTVGTAAFLTEGLFVPVSLQQNLGVTGLYSARTDRVREIFNERAQQGEPFEYIPDEKHALSNPHASKAWAPIAYIPSLVGTRKDKEMVDALKAGYLVLAEKPAFPNADFAKAFLANLNKEHQKRLFFGWHYQRHYVFRRLLEDVNKNTFGKIKHIRTLFQVPMPLNTGRLFNVTQGGAAIDIYCYNLHYTLRLLGFNHSFEVVQSKIESAQFLDKTNPDLAKVDFALDTKLKFGNGATADLVATFDPSVMIHSEGEILFEDGTRILCKEFVHSHMIVKERFDPILIFRAGGASWERYLNEDDLKNAEYWKTTYDRQIEFIHRQAVGEEKYDVVNNDIDGLGLEANIKLHEIIDAVLVKGGFEKKTSA